MDYITAEINDVDKMIENMILSSPKSVLIFLSSGGKRLCCWAGLTPGSNEQWNPSDLYKIDMPVALVEKQKANLFPLVFRRI